MFTKLFRNASYLKSNHYFIFWNESIHSLEITLDLRSQKRNSSYGHHHMTPLEVDIVNKNTMDFLPKPKVLL